MSIRPCTHAGFAAVELSTPALRLVALHGTGPRLAWFGPAGGDNLLFWHEAKPPLERSAPGGRWTLRGGHRVWTAAMGADESETTYRPDNEAGACELHADGFTVSGATDPVTRTCRSITVRILRDDRLEVVNRIVNQGDMLFACGLWALTCTKPGPETRYVMPLGDGSAWDTSTITVFRTWAGHGTGDFRDDQFALCEDAYVLTPRGRETKRMVMSPAGIIALTDAQRGVSFSIATAHEAHATYPVNANLAAYVGPDNFMVEMETMGPHAVLKPGQRLEHRQVWTIAPRAIAATGAAARALAG